MVKSIMQHIRFTKKAKKLLENKPLAYAVLEAVRSTDYIMGKEVKVTVGNSTVTIKSACQ